MKQLSFYFSELALLFVHNYDVLFFAYLKEKSIPNTTTCGKGIKKGDGGWTCKDCELTSSILCNDCFVKEKHIGHEVYFNPSGWGFVFVELIQF